MLRAGAEIEPFFGSMLDLIDPLAPFSTSLPTSAEECQKFKISLPYFEIENVSILKLQCYKFSSSEPRINFGQCSIIELH